MMSNSRRSARNEECDHVAGVDDGAGCTEIWAHLSERRGESD